MNEKDPNLKIEPHEQSPLVNRLVFIIETLQSQLAAQSEKIDLLLTEIRQLKKLPAKPNIKPSTLPKVILPQFNRHRFVKLNEEVSNAKTSQKIYKRVQTRSC
ncbi:MAG: hypothetical protein WC748_05150 [Legionellales bacterium]|jgi:hypothetical protein